MDALQKAILNFLFAGSQVPSEIADFFEVSLREVEEALAKLEAMGYVRKKGDEVELTERGKSAVMREVLELHVHAPW